MMNRFSQKNKNTGVTLVEILFYTAVFAVVSLVIVQSMIAMVNAFRQNEVNSDLAQASTIMEKISREIRDSTSINSITSTTIDLDDSVSATTVDFILSGTDIEYYEDDVLIGDLNSTNLSINSLDFTQITTAESVAVKVEMTVQSNRHNSTKTVTYYDTLVLRGSY